MTTEATESKYLGYANGWSNDSPEKTLWDKCWKECPNDARETKTIGRCRTETHCKNCGITYRIDSSD